MRFLCAKTCLLLLLLVVLPSLFGGCGLFDPRDPELPGGTGVAWIPPTEPETLFVNIKNAVEGKVIANYVQNFTVDFVFHPDPSDSIEITATQPGIYDDWTLDVERTVTQTIFDQSASLRLTFTKRDTTTYVGTDERIYYYKYELQIVYKVGGAEYFYGLSDYYVRQDGGLWYVYMWVDKRDPDRSTYRTWGYLKGTRR